MRNLILYMLLAVSAHGQDTVTVKHSKYTSVFVQSAHIPALVYYTLRASDLTCNDKLARTNRFTADPEVQGTSLSKDYAGSGYDQGHNMSAQDNTCSETGMRECFYYTNMFPQTPQLNRGVWKKLEMRERVLAQANDSIEVFIGSYGAKEHIGPDNVTVPEYCWKAIYIPLTKSWETHIFRNDASDEDNYSPTAQQQQWIDYIVRQHFER